MKYLKTALSIFIFIIVVTLAFLLFALLVYAECSTASQANLDYTQVGGAYNALSKMF